LTALTALSIKDTIQPDFSSPTAFLSIHALRRSSSKQFLAQLKSMFDAIKIIADGTVYQEILSVSNADSTLQIVKEQQPIFRSRAGKPQRTLLFAKVYQLNE